MRKVPDSVLTMQSPYSLEASEDFRYSFEEYSVLAILSSYKLRGIYTYSPLILKLKP